MQIGFFKTGTPKQFNYKPRYYNEEKERQEERRKRIQEGGSDGGESIRREIDRRWRRADRANRSKSRGINLLVFLAIAALLAYFVFFT
ncbi:MAG: hypothetical protein IH598_04180 [Bacteroidales bacterium]|nr:hypothetical protein [Bacteroidales bacterium]